MSRSAAFRFGSAVLLAAAIGASARSDEPAPAVSLAPVEIAVVTDGGDPVADAVVLLRPAAPEPAAVAPGDLVMTQHDLQFDPHVLVATVGSNVAFPNEDQVQHHVYSFSDAKTFELRLYGGEAEHVVLFDQPGVVALGCNIHDNMIAFVYVADTPYTGKTGADGRVRIEAPAGGYTLAVWHENLRGEEEISRPVAIAEAGQFETVAVELRRPRRRESY